MSVIEAPGSLTRGYSIPRHEEVYISGVTTVNATSSTATVGNVAGDIQNAPSAQVRVTRSELLGHTLVCAVEESRASRVDRTSVQTLLNVVSELIGDNFPTPQVSASGEGAVMAKWIVNGRSLTVDCTQHVVDIWAHDNDGNEFLADELDGRFFSARPVAAKARRFLEELSREVSNRVQLRTLPTRF